ncbi:hypothetical protein [Pseudomonas chlororaphis]|uniref:hypothetical protein n=1 Tax=Pseudomonas chlororaphis TaxID=587753 RepID=UPI0011CD9B04|nr:hypothetical protein [Pseudomonas chlororaphis]WDG52886.1 hypothetical protein PUP76_23945 [Pseudomonas chlororaphis]WDH86092.1 hypothetical protein PUP74_18235 [Pseudomonas chlororaphis]
MGLAQMYDEVFSGITIDEIRRRIDFFYKHSASWNDGKTLEFILDLAIGKTGFARMPRIPISRRSYPKNANFIRARNLRDEPAEKNFLIGDMWEAPAKVVKAGRLNAPGEQFLYATEGQIKAPKLEVGVAEDDPYLLIFYKSTDDIELIDIGWQEEAIPEYFGVHADKAKEILDFINSSFRKDEIYMISNIIAKEVHQRGFDGWCYPSVKIEGAINVCFNLSAKRKLDFSGAFVARDHGDQNSVIAVFVDGDAGLASFSDWQNEKSLAKKFHDEIWADYMQTGDLSDLKEKNKSTSPELVYILKPSH